MLGDFTSGMFGGANNVFSLATKYQELRTKFRDWDNANEVESAMRTGPNDSGTGGLYDWLGSVGQRMRAFSTSHINGAPAQQPQQPPAYLPPQTPPVPVGPQQPAPGASPGALQGPMSGAGYPSAPGLAMQQSPLAP